MSGSELVKELVEQLDAAQAHADHAKALAAMSMTSTLTSNPTVVTP